jgi:hypothetical protein
MEALTWGQKLNSSIEDACIRNMAKTVEIIIWFAGFYEAEGSVSNDISNDNKIRLMISQNDRTPLDEACRLWGGSVREKVRISITGKECHGHEWRLSHHDSLQFLNDIRPYMRVPYKIQQLERVLANSEVRLHRRFKCNYCDKDYASPSGRRRHEKIIHLQDNQVLVPNNGGDTTKLQEHPESLVHQATVGNDGRGEGNDQGMVTATRIGQLASNF